MADWRPLILPREHGIWGLLAGAALVGLPLGHTLAGLPLLIAAVAGVVIRQAVSGTCWRSHVVLCLAAMVAASMLWICAVSAGSRVWFWWVLGAITCGAISVLWTSRRSWGGSATVGVACGALAGAVATAGGAPQTWAMIASLALSSHLVLTVPLVRAQTRPDPYWSRLAVDGHILVAVAAVGCWAADLIPSGVPLVFLFGLARMALLVDKRTPMSVSPRTVGLRELAWMPVVATAIVIGLRLPAC